MNRSARPGHARIAEMLRQRFFSALHLGLIQPGGKLPSARELAVELGVDRRVVLRAYHELESEGLVELSERSGVFFSDSAPGLPGLSPPAEWAIDVLANGVTMGIPVPQFPDHFKRYVANRKLRAVCIECNRDQISLLCSEMSSDYGFDAEGADSDELLAESKPRQSLLDADLLVTTRFHAGEVQEIAASIDRQWIAVSLRTDIYSEIARLIRTSSVYFVVADERYAKKLVRIFSSVDSVDGFHPLVAGRDDVSQVPVGSPVYVTRAARELLHGDPILNRVIPQERVFSKESAREILRLVVSTNLSSIERAQA